MLQEIAFFCRINLMYYIIAKTPGCFYKLQNKSKVKSGNRRGAYNEHREKISRSERKHNLTTANSK